MTDAGSARRTPSATVRRLVAVAGLVLVSTTGAGAGRAAATSPASAPVTRTETISRTHLVDGQDVQADKRTVTVSVSATRDLRDRQAVSVTWKGAHPTGGLVFDHNSGAAAQEEYPVVVMQCRGVDSASAAPSKRISPQTCWTQTPGERFQYSPTGSVFPSYRMDRYASRTDRGYTVNQPDPLPAGCPDVAIPYWVPFRAADGTVYPGGNLGCGGLAPEAANSADSLQPGSTTYGVADAKGSGSTKFIMQNSDSNASLGCSATVACSLVVIPIMGISCDAAGTAPGGDAGLPPADRPDPGFVPTVFGDCSRTGRFAAGEFNSGGEVASLPVTGSLWWAASNWRNRVSVPLTFAPSASVCDVVSNSQSIYLYGSEGLAQATQQWAPSFCLDPKLFTLRHVQTSEPQAKNLLNSGTIEGAIQAGPPATPFTTPTVQAPAAITGWGIAYSIDGNDGSPYTSLRLDARLLAKLLSESYRSCADCLDFTSKASVTSGFAKLATNPIDLSRDPEFEALNPGVPTTNYLQSAATLEVMSSDSDVMSALTSYIDADPEARAWLDGTPDPWGMVVNPAYRRITLPVTSWPLLDTHIATLATGSNQCLTANPVPWLPLVASPVSNPATVALHLQFDIANSQINCKDNGSQTQKLTAIGRQAPGSRFVLGLVALGDAARYQLNTAALQTHRASNDTATFTTAAGRSFVTPTDAALRAAARMLAPKDTLGTWPVPYGPLRTSAAGAAAYPGTLLTSIDVPTSGLPKADAARYAQLLRFVAGPGQSPGLGNGHLPSGYLPLSSTNGLGALAAYTSKAATAVAAQRGAVPPVSGRVPPRAATPTPSSRPTAGSSQGSTGSTGGGAGTSVTGNVTGPGGGAAAIPGSTVRPAATKPSGPAAASTAAAPASVPPAAAAGRTTSLNSGPLGLALPALALMALVALSAGALTGGVRRR